jgi:hypothetical protein
LVAVAQNFGRTPLLSERPSEKEGAMKAIWLAVAAAMLPGVAQADNFDDPKALVTALYEPYTHGARPPDLASFYSDGLREMFAKHRQAEAYLGGVGEPIKVADTRQPDFDPFVDARHYLLFDLTISDPVVNGDHALVSVSYKNFDHPTQLSVSLLKTQEGWKVDDIASMGSDQHWLLSWLLTYDPLGVH